MGKAKKQKKIKAEETTAHFVTVLFCMAQTMDYEENQGHYDKANKIYKEAIKYTNEWKQKS